MDTIIKKNLAEIVRENHKAAAVFEKYQLDFCCKGKRSLEQACREKNLSPEEIRKELETVLRKTNQVTDFNTMNLSSLINHIVNTHHEYVKSELPQLEAYLKKIASKHGQRHPELFKIFDTVIVLKEEMESHMQKEEMVLFPRIKEVENNPAFNLSQNRPGENYLKDPVTMMEQEHDHAGSLLEELSQLTNQYRAPSDACTTYRICFAALHAFEIDLHQHVHLENNILFPKAIQLISNLQHRFQSRNDN